MDATPHYAVIGGGWAGCAAAVTLAAAGRRVSLFEAGRTLGGRARRIEVDGRSLDNGQHILLGAYRATLKLLKQIGVNADEAMLRLPLQMRYPEIETQDGMDFLAPRLPAPLHLLLALLRAKGLTREDKLALARFSSAARWMGWTLNDDCSVIELLERFDQTERLTRLMWAPLCVAALNTPPERASAQVFLNVLRDSLGARRAASDMLLPRTDLTRLLPQPAADFVGARGGKLYLGQSVAAISPGSTRQGDAAARWRLALKNPAHALETDLEFDAVILATGPETAADLLGEIAFDDTNHEAAIGRQIDAIRALQYEPITTCYLQYDADTRMAAPFYALLDDPAQAAWGQFVFDRGQLSANPADAGLLAVVVSAAGNAIADGHAALAQGIAAQLARSLQQPALNSPQWSRVISEKRATFSCTPGLQRPDNEDLPPGLRLAGDYLAGDYPATLEGAVLSGIASAQSLLKQIT
jgi:squalene-associated FAD-dependent desaturase